MTYNQTKCGIIYERIAMGAGDDEQMIINNNIPGTSRLIFIQIYEN